MTVDLDQIQAALEAAGRLAGLRRLGPFERRLGSLAGFAGNVEVAGSELEIRVELASDFPLSLPLISVANHMHLGFIPHLTQIGDVCYREPEGSVHSLWHPDRVVVESLDLALATLARSIIGLDPSGYIEEAEWWWSRQPGVTAYASFIEPMQQVKRIRRVRINALFPTEYIVDDSKSSRSIVAVSELVSEGVYIPLGRACLRMPLVPDTLLQLPSLRASIHGCLDRDNRKLLRRRLRHHDRFVIVAIPRPSQLGDVALLGIEFDGDTPVHPFDPQRSNEQARDLRLRPFLLSRFDRSRLLQRGGASMRHAGRTVAVVGCGAVGGYVADALAHTGIDRLVLIDPDILQPYNAYRHTCGMMLASMPKALVLASMLQAKLPQVHCEPVISSIERFLAREVDGRVTPESIDLYVIAVGNPTLSRWISRELIQAHRKRAVFTWLEPLGLGGHVFVNAAAGHRGCFECLFQTADGIELLSPRCEFAEPDQNSLERLGGCGTSFTPYSDLDARRTAELAARIVVSTLTDSNPHSRLRSWKGAADEFIQRGLRLTPRVELSSDEMDVQGQAISHDACPVCRRTSSIPA